MNPIDDGQVKTRELPVAGPSKSAAILDDPRIIQVIQDYMAALEAGEKPDRYHIENRYPDIADALSGCLDALEFVHSAAPQLHAPAAGPPPGTPRMPGDFYPSAPLGDYRIIREIGRGGMGIVYEAEQMSLGRRVALKVLPFAAALDAKQLQRFKNEAQAAAHLHHTNIVPVIAVGRERGVHYYVMQFIEGQTLAAFIGDMRHQAGLKDQTELPLTVIAATRVNHSQAGTGSRDLGDEPSTGPYLPLEGTPSIQAALVQTKPAVALTTERSSKNQAFYRTAARLMMQAAEALEHAHQLGIIHRDIKPANLLVDARGNLWITDFGLARLHNDASLTKSGDLLGTIRYMSPEQALGKRGQVDQRTDIYSLGVTLYELLTLEPPFGGIDRQELLRQIAFEEPRGPRKRRPGIPAELDTIVRKAINKSPLDRYASAHELADDLQRFLNDQPIRARRPTPRQQLARWFRRHPGVVTTVAVSALLFLLLGIMGLWINNVMIHKEEARTKSAYELEAQQRSRAERNLGLAKMTLDRIYLRLAQDRLPRDSRQEKEYRDLLTQALKFYEQIAEENGADQTVRLEMAEAWWRVGDIHTHLGRRDLATEAFRHAIEVADELAAQFPLRARLMIAECENSWATVLADNGDGVNAEKHFHLSLDARRALVKDFPRQEALLNGLGATQANLGLFYRGQGDLVQARKLLENAIENQRSIAGKQIHHSEYHGRLAHHLWTLANVVLAQGDRVQAKKIMEEALAIYQELFKESPKERVYRAELGDVQNDLAVILIDDGDLRGADREYHQALDMQQQLVADFSNVPQYRRDLELTHNNLGILLMNQGDRAAAADHFRQARSLQEQLVADFPTEPRYRQDLARCHNNQASLFKEAGNTGSALKEQRRAFDLFAKLAADYPAVPSYRHDLGVSHFNLGCYLQAAEARAAARDQYMQSLALQENLANEYPAIPRYRQCQALCQTNLSNISLEAGDPNEARARQQRAIAIQEKLVDDFPVEPQFKLELASSHRNLGVIFQDAGDLVGAASEGKHALDFLLVLAASPSHLPKYRTELGRVWYFLGYLNQLEGKYLDAGRDCRQALNLQESLVAEFPKVSIYRQYLVASQNALAWNLAMIPGQEANHLTQALDLAQEALDHYPKRALYWRTLGLTRYRRGDFASAVHALEKAVQLDSSDDGTVEFILTMAQWHEGRWHQARQWFNQGILLMGQSKAPGMEVRRFRAEAAGVMSMN